MPSSRSISLRAAVPIALTIAAARADQDPLLGLGLDPHERAHGDQAVALLDLLDLHLDGVRDLLAGAAQHLLAHQLGEHTLLGLVGDLVGREVERPLGQQRDEVLDQRPDAVPCGRRPGRPRRRARARRRPGSASHGAAAVEPVDLVDGDHHRHAGAAQRLGDEAVARPADALLAVEHEQRRVGVGQLAAPRGAACAR